MMTKMPMLINTTKEKAVTMKMQFTKGELFYFDPNTISTSDWKRLGLRDKTIKTIENYLSKGGHFYKPERSPKNLWTS